MADFITIFAGLMTCTTIGLGGVLAYLYLKDEKQEEQDLILNFGSHENRGRFIGTQKDVEWGAGGRSRRTYEPKDVDWKRLRKAKLTLQDEKFITDPYHFNSYPKGTLSKDKNIHFKLPDSPHQMSEAFKSTPFGLMMLQFTSDMDFLKKRIEIAQKANKSRDELLNEIGDAEMTEEMVSRYKGYVKDMTEMMADIMQSSSKKSKFEFQGSGVQPGGPAHV